MKRPMWLEVLLAQKFFTACAKHDYCKKNEKNVFCLDCIISICQHCVCDHNSHQLLQIRRYVYHDVIRLHDIQKLLDCSRVQAYTINSARVVFLKERPQPKSNKGLGGNCETCERSLQDAYKFCSVACKVDMSYTPRQPEGAEMECVACDISTTTHRSISCQVKLMASCNDDENVVGNQEVLELDLTTTTSTTSSESIQTAGGSSLSTHSIVDKRSTIPTFHATTPIITKSHHLAHTTSIRAPRRPRPNHIDHNHNHNHNHHHHYHSQHDSFTHFNKPSSVPALINHSSLLIPSSLSRRRKCKKPHRSPFS